MDLMNGTYSYSNLESKYNSFQVPAAKLKIGGEDILARTDIYLSSINITLSLEAAGIASFVISPEYNNENSSASDDIKKGISLGKTVTAHLGYGSDLTEVFKGYVASIKAEYDADTGVSYTITALDARALMMTDNVRIKSYEIKNYSDAVKKVLNRYSSLCKAEIDATTENFDPVFPLRQKNSDYSFIQDSIIKDGKVDREFFILDDKVYFRKPKKVTSPIMTLSSNAGLKSFERTAEYLDTSFEVFGRKNGTNDFLSGKADAKGKEEQTSALSEKGVKMLARSGENEQTKQQLDAIAKNRADMEIAERQNASGSCVGLPEIVPGRFISIDKIDPMLNKKYYIYEVTHSYSEGGFITSFKTKGWQ